MEAVREVERAMDVLMQQSEIEIPDVEQINSYDELAIENSQITKVDIFIFYINDPIKNQFTKSLADEFHYVEMR